MPILKPRRIPAYPHYRPKNLAVVGIDRHDHYLGGHNSPESKEKYARLIAEHFRGDTASGFSGGPSETDLTIVEIAAACWTQHVQTCHTKNRRPSGRQCRLHWPSAPSATSTVAPLPASSGRGSQLRFRCDQHPSQRHPDEADWLLEGPGKDESIGCRAEEVASRRD